MAHHRPPPPPWTFYGSFYPKNILIAGLLAAAFMFVTDMILFGFVATDYFTLPGMRETPLIGCNVIGYIIGGFLFSTVYAIYAWPNKIIDGPDKGNFGHPAKNRRGLVFGCFISLLIFLPISFIYHSLFEGWSLTVGLVEVLFRMIQFAIAGVIVAHMLPDSDSMEGYKPKPPKSL